MRDDGGFPRRFLDRLSRRGVSRITSPREDKAEAAHRTASVHGNEALDREQRITKPISDYSRTRSERLKTSPEKLAALS